MQQALIKIKQFLTREYPRELLLKDLIRAIYRRRQDLLTLAPQPQTQDHSTQQILVTTFHPSFGGLCPIVRDNWDILGSSQKTTYLHQRRLVTGLRKPNNTRDLLVRAKTDFHPQATQTSTTPLSTRTYNICSTRQCRYCSRLDTSGKITSKTTGRSYSTKINVSCKSSNLIYAIQCTRCRQQYVGQTERKLMARLCEHFCKVTHKRLHTDMGRHFCTPPHLGIDDMKIFVLDFIPCHPHSCGAEQLRDQRESHWIQNLLCIAPQGLNLRDTPKYRRRRDTI